MDWIIHYLGDWIFSIRQEDNLRARRIHTQFGIVKRILIVIIFIFAITSVLMSFEKFRNVGAGILASAGLALMSRFIYKTAVFII